MVQRAIMITTHTAVEERHRNAIIAVVIQLVVAIVGFSIALRVYLYTDNIKAGAYWSHAVLAFGSFIFLLGLHLKQNGKGWIIGGMVLNILSLIMAFIGVILDAVQAGHVAETDFSRCTFSFVAGTAYCRASNVYVESCSMAFQPRTCYCCYLYSEHRCDTFGLSLSTQPDHYNGAQCSQIQGEYQALLWTSMGFNILGFILAVISCALVATYRSSLSTIQQGPVSLMMRQSLSDSYDGRVGHGPVVIFSQQQAVGYYPMGLPYPVAPPDYNTAMASAAPPVRPGCSLREASSMPPVEGPTSYSAPYGNLEPPPYAP